MVKRYGPLAGTHNNKYDGKWDPSLVNPDNSWGEDAEIDVMDAIVQAFDSGILRTEMGRQIIDKGKTRMAVDAYYQELREEAALKEILQDSDESPFG